LNALPAVSEQISEQVASSYVRPRLYTAYMCSSFCQTTALCAAVAGLAHIDS